jgi:hypothetical protein
MPEDAAFVDRRFDVATLVYHSPLSRRQTGDYYQRLAVFSALLREFRWGTTKGVTAPPTIVPGGLCGRLTADAMGP